MTESNARPVGVHYARPEGVHYNHCVSPSVHPWSVSENAHKVYNQMFVFTSINCIS